MEAFLTGFLYVLGGGVGLAVLGILLSTTVQGVVKFRSRERKETPSRDDRKRLLLETQQRANDLLESDERVKQVFEELGSAVGKYERAKLQKRLRELVEDEAVRRVFYSRTR